MTTALGVVAGYVVYWLAILVLYAVAGREPHAAGSLGFLAGSTVLRMGFAAAGGLVAARIAGPRHRTAVLSLALVLAAGAVVSLMERPDVASRWPQLAGLLLVAPSPLGADWLRQALARSRPTERSSPP